MIRSLAHPCDYHQLGSRTVAFSCGARSASGLIEKRLLEKHAVAPSAARLCFMKGRQVKKTVLLAGRPFFGRQPHNLPVSSQLAPPGFFSSILTSAILRDFSERPGPDFLLESADHCFI